jgi:protein SMG6
MEGLMQCLFLLIVTEAAHLEPGYRSAVQENALVVSLQMFNLILEKCVSLLREQLGRPKEAQSSGLIVSEDMQVLLPAVKVNGIYLLISYC